MVKERITYTDYNGNERTEDFYFDLSEAELAEWQYSHDGGLREYLRKIVDADDQKQIIGYFKEILLKSYGIKSDDGRSFLKTDDIRLRFESSPAYSQIFMKLANDEAKAGAFINGIMPKDLDKKYGTGENTAVTQMPQITPVN